MCSKEDIRLIKLLGAIQIDTSSKVGEKRKRRMYEIDVFFQNDMVYLHCSKNNEKFVKFLKREVGENNVGFDSFSNHVFISKVDYDKFVLDNASNLFVQKQEIQHKDRKKFDVDLYVCNGLVYIRNEELPWFLMEQFGKNKVFIYDYFDLSCFKKEDYIDFLKTTSAIINVNSYEESPPPPMLDIDVYYKNEHVIIVFDKVHCEMYEDLYPQSSIYNIDDVRVVFCIPDNTLTLRSLRFATCCESDTLKLGKKIVPQNIWEVINDDLCRKKYIHGLIDKDSRTFMLQRILKEIHLEYRNIDDFVKLNSDYSKEEFYKLLKQKNSLGEYYRRDFNNWYQFRGYCRYNVMLSTCWKNLLEENHIGFASMVNPFGMAIKYTNKEIVSRNFKLKTRSMLSKRYLYVDVRFEASLIDYERNTDREKHLKVIVPLSISDGDFHHANSLVIDLIEKSIYRYEPHGSNTYCNRSIDIDNELRSFFSQTIPSFKFIPGSSYQDDVGPQIIELKQTLYCKVKSRFGSKERYLEAQGFCAAWTFLLFFSIVLFPKKTIPEIVKTFVSLEPNELATLIRLFQSYVIKILSSHTETKVFTIYVNHREDFLNRLDKAISLLKARIEDCYGDEKQLKKMKRVLRILEDKKVNVIDEDTSAIDEYEVDGVDDDLSKFSRQFNL